MGHRSQRQFDSYALKNCCKNLYPRDKLPKFKVVWICVTNVLGEKGKNFNKKFLLYTKGISFMTKGIVVMTRPHVNTRGLSPRPVEAWCVAHAQWRVTTQDLPNLYFSFSSLSFAPVRVLIASSWVSTYQGHKIVVSSLSECPLKSKTKWETVSEYIRLCNHQLILFIMSGHVVQNYQFLRSILAL